MNTLKKHTQKNAFFLQEVVKQRDETKVKKMCIIQMAVYTGVF